MYFLIAAKGVAKVLAKVRSVSNFNTTQELSALVAAHTFIDRRRRLHHRLSGLATASALADIPKITQCATNARLAVSARPFSGCCCAVYTWVSKDKPKQVSCGYRTNTSGYTSRQESSCNSL